MLTDTTEIHFGEDNRLIATTDFDFAEVDRRLGTPDDPQDCDYDRAGAAIRKIVRWQWAGGCTNPEGAICRDTVLAMVFLPEMQAVSATQIAKSLGKHKQSLGRWMADFKKFFPELPSAHFRNL